MTRDELVEKLKETSEYDDQMRLADGFEDACIGIVRCKGRESVVAYSVEKCLEILQTRDGMTREEAEEYFEFNVVDAYVGPHTPAFIEGIES